MGRAVVRYSLLEGAVAPSRANPTDAGADLRARFVDQNHEIKLMPGTRALIGTGVYVAIEPGWYGRVAPRSGLAWADGIDVLAGVVDSGYRGEVGVILINHGPKPVVIRHGMKVAQLIIERCNTDPWERMSVLPDGDGRGGKGYGSTGV